jgi:predicted RNA binding protein YcfA (HicA-like mRNA interferase family)
MLFSEVERVLLDFGFRVRRTSGSHVWFSKPGVGNIAIPTKSGRYAKRVYLEQVCTLLDLDRLNLDKLDELLGLEAED